MHEAEIVRLNIERFRRMLQTELDLAARLTIERMLNEFEARISSTCRPSEQAGAIDPQNGIVNKN